MYMGGILQPRFHDIFTGASVSPPPSAGRELPAVPEEAEAGIDSISPVMALI